MLSEEEFEQLSGTRIDFKDFLFDRPEMDSLDLERSRDPMREVEL